MTPIVSLIGLLLAFPGQTKTPTISDPLDKQILKAFLEHVRDHSAQFSTPEHMAKYAAQPEDITWVASKYIRMPLIAAGLTGETTYLDEFVKRMDALYGCLETGPDGFSGWYGLPLELFRDPAQPDRKVDVMLTSFVMAGVSAEFARTVQADPALAARYREPLERYLALAENHLVKKWEARGNYNPHLLPLTKGELEGVLPLTKGELEGVNMGAVYITHPGLAPTKAHLTQPHNKHSKIIRALLNLYAATQKDEYLIKAVKLGTRFKRCLTLVEGHYEWHYWDPAGPWDVHPEDPNRWKHWIGAEHKGGYYSLSLSQAVLLYEHGLVFDRTDIERFVKTQTTVCWNGDLHAPKWFRVNGQPMEESYLCSALAPFNESVYEMAFGAQAQQERLKHKDHGWHGGVIAGDWLEFKYLIFPRWKTGEPAEQAVVAPFRAKPENRALLEALAFEVQPPGYQAPMQPVRRSQ
jgi:hypothetical protein